MTRKKKKKIKIKKVGINVQNTAKCSVNSGNDRVRRQTEIIKRLLCPIREEKLENQDKRRGILLFLEISSRLVHLENVGNSYRATIPCNAENRSAS